jgi:PAS domain S-box-containing protein
MRTGSLPSSPHRALSVLLVEDSEVDAELIIQELRRCGYDITCERVQTAGAMEAALERGPWDLVLSDYSMPAFSATAALGILQRLNQDLPFIIVSGTIGEETAVSALKAGAHDFLAKGRLARLGPAIERELRDAEERRQRRQLKHLLDQQAASFRALFEGNPLPMWVYELETLQFLAVNDAAVRLYGYSRDDFLAMRITEIRPAEDVPALLANLAQRRDNWEHSGDWRHRTKLGQVIDVEVKSHRLPFNGRSGVLVVVHDVTERKRLEAQFLQAQKMEAIGRLAGGIAHDFNNLLTGILGYCDLLLVDLPEGDPRRDDLEEIKRGGEHAAGLTRQLLAFSRKQVIAPRVLDLNAIITDTCRMLGRIVGEDVEIHTGLAEDVGHVSADPGQMSQLLVNLVVNARDAMTDGGKLTIETNNVQLDEHYASMHLAVVPGPYVMLAVSDTGCGMSPEVQARLFEPFFTTKEPGKGTGLGLASVYGIVKQSRGNIWVYSEPGRGTTFKIFLPQVDAPLTETPKLAAPVKGQTAATILVVEDNPALEKLTCRILRRIGYTVLSASSAEEALQISGAHKGPIDLLLSDVVMRGESGPALANQLIAQRPRLQVVHMSGYTEDAIVRHGVITVSTAFIEKPFTPDVLTQKVQEALSGRRA